MSAIPIGPKEQDEPSPSVSNTRLILGQTITVRHTALPQASLRFYVDNPRVHSSIRADGVEPTQSDIENYLVRLDHVKKLAAEIEAEGGLHDAVIVHAGTSEVLEGNCRLAAYRILAKKDIRWDNMRCEVLPADIDEDLIFSLLAQYHINGKLAWAPFEQAGFFFREYMADQSKRDHQSKIEALARKGGGITTRRAEHLVSTYDFMQANDDAVADHWSHYDEYFKSRDIGKARKSYPELDKKFVEIVPTVPAEDIRKLAKICSQERILKKFVGGTADFQQAYGMYLESGADATAYQKFSRFRNWLADDAVRTEITQYAGQERQKVILEVKKLELLLSKLHNAMTDGPPVKRKRR